MVESHRELRNESPAKLRWQKLCTATLGVREPPPALNVRMFTAGCQRKKIIWTIPGTL